MKKIGLILSIVFILFLQGCEPNMNDLPDFEGTLDKTIYDYISENSDEYSSFLKIIQRGKIAQALASYNPDGQGYTLFLPNNNAVQNFIESNDRFNTLEDLLKDQDYINEFCRYHVIKMAVISNDFPFGAFTEKTLSDDFLTVSFINEPDTTYYKINNLSVVVRPNIETSNGYIHVIESTLIPITFTALEWFRNNDDYSIFYDALLLTGLDAVINIGKSENVFNSYNTILVEADSIYKNANINSIDDLIQLISPDNDQYSDEFNPLYNFVAYHILKGSYFIDDFVDVNTLYTTHSSVSLDINGTGLDILINKGRRNFDTLYSSVGDTTFIDYILFKYDESNVISQTGPIHFIDRIMRVERQSPKAVTFEFYEEPLLNLMREEGGSFLLNPSDDLEKISWSGNDLYYVKYIGPWQQGNPNGNDMLTIEGDFSISYDIPEIIPGSYDLVIRANGKSQLNAVVEVFFDGRKIGGLIDLTNYGNNNNTFQNISVGQVDINNITSHTVEIRPLIPGRLLWDFVRFEPVN